MFYIANYGTPLSSAAVNAINSFVALGTTPAGSALTKDAGGNFVNTAIATGGSPGGSDGQLQYRVNSSTFGGISGATSNGSTTTFLANNLSIADQTTPTKIAQFSAASISAATTRTYTLPDASDTVVLLTLAQTVANKTLGNTNIVTLRDDRFTLQDDADNTKQAVFQLSGISTATTRTFTLPDLTSTIAVTGNNLGVFAATTSAQLAGVISDETGSGSLVFATSPTLVTPNLGVATATSLNGLTISTTTGTFTLTNAKTLAVTNTLTLSGTDSTVMTFPNATDTVMGLGATQTVTGAKTFGSALLIATRPKITTSIDDSNGNASISIVATGSAVNSLQVTNAATGSTGPLIKPVGETNVDLRIGGLGTGKVAMQSSVNHGAFTSYFTETDNGNSSTADTIDWTLSNKQKSTLTGNCTFTFTSPPGPCSLVFKLVQDATGSRIVTWPATVHWSGGTAPTLTTTANKVDIITFYWDGTTYFGNSTLNFTA